ncbi:MAG: S1C family serine protease, partial [Planctomycetia bacterium]
VGEMVWAIGNPFGLDRTITYGIISGVGRRGVVDNPFQEFLQTDASINPGNSGGPLVDVHGRVLGITTAIVGKGFRGIGFAIPTRPENKSRVRRLSARRAAARSPGSLSGFMNRPRGNGACAARGRAPTARPATA